MMLRPGVYLQDRYEVLEQIGSGGMSEVYKAKCHKLNRLVAIKVLKDEFSSDATFVSKFKMEAQAAAGLSHPNIVSVYDVIDEGKLHYIVMELIEGITLKTYIARKGRLEAKESTGIAIQVAQGIAAAHEQHIIHRDIKPQNMIISRDGKVKVADFGIARAVSAQTMNSAAMGSVHYISPEQARGGYTDVRSDIYSLGITMYEMVTGRLPFEGDTTVAVALAHLEGKIVPPRAYVPDLPYSLEQIILKCTEKKPDYRYQTVNEVIADLRRSLVEPDGDFVMESEAKQAVRDHGTKVADRDMSRIREQMSDRDEPVREYARERVGDVPARDPSRYPKRDRRPEDTGRDENIHIERLLAGAGIVVAIVIVAVLVVVFSRLGGIFRSGTELLDGTLPSSEEVVMTDKDGQPLSGTEVVMPDLLEMPQDMAEKMLREDYSLVMKRTYQSSETVEEGLIISQDPVQGSVVPKWSNVNVVVSEGSSRNDLTTLGLLGMSVDSAKQLLEERSYLVKIVEEENETIEKGGLIRFEPERAEAGSTVTLYISSGPHVETVDVPQLTGITEEEALALLGEAGLTVGDTTTEHSDTVPQGTIIRQATEAGAKLPIGGKVGYVVSSGPEESKGQRYVATIDAVYDLSNLIGPGAGSANIRLMIRLRQEGPDGEPVYYTLMEPRTMEGEKRLPVSYTSIESRNGTDQGVVEVVEADSGAVLQTYPLTFYAMD